MRRSCALFHAGVSFTSCPPSPFSLLPHSPLNHPSTFILFLFLFYFILYVPHDLGFCYVPHDLGFWHLTHSFSPCHIFLTSFTHIFHSHLSLASFNHIFQSHLLLHVSLNTPQTSHSITPISCPSSTFSKFIKFFSSSPGLYESISDFKSLLSCIENFTKTTYTPLAYLPHKTNKSNNLHSLFESTIYLLALPRNL